MAGEKLLQQLPEEQRGRVVEFDGFLYATLDFEPPDSTVCGPQSLPEPKPVPPGWELAPDYATVAEGVAAKHPWGTALLVTCTGAGFTTALWRGQGGSKISNFELVTVDGDRHGPRRCLPSRPSRVLIRYPAGLDPQLPALVTGPPSFLAGRGHVALEAEAAGAPAAEPLPVALFFPGQGSQYVGMLGGVKDLPRVREMLERAREVLGYDLLELCLEGPEAKLEETRYCQPALFIAGLAGVEKLRGERPEAVERPSAMAGLSLGEYTALCAAGALPFEEGLRLVKLRGEAMQEAAEVGDQRMLSVAGLERERLEELCGEARGREGPGAVCQIANHLFPSGFAVGGTGRAIVALKELADKAGALQAKELKTSGAFHTPLMQPAQDRLAAALEEALPSMRPPRCRVWMNASAAAVEPGCEPREIVELLKRQLTSPVRWAPSVQAILGEGVEEFYEVGPMKQIKAMMKRIDAKAWKATQNVEV